MAFGWTCDDPPVMKPAARAVAELAAWGVAVTGVVLLLDAGRRDDWLFLLVMVGGLVFLVRIVVWSVRLDRMDTRFNRFCNRHERAFYWTFGPVFLVVIWATMPFEWPTILFTCAATVAAVGQFGEWRTSEDEAAN